MFKSNSKRLGFVFLCSASFAFVSAYAQTAPDPKKTETVTIGKMTEVAQEVALEKLYKEKRDLKGEKLPEIAQPVAVPGAGLAQPMQAPVPARVVPTPPGVSGIYGAGGALRARLESGVEVQAGAKLGDWKVVSVQGSGVSFERCEVVRKTRKSKPQSECVSEFVSPSTTN